MRIDPATAWTKGVSRSFYLSIRILPAAMRPAVAAGYLLARASDTVADSSSAPLEMRLQALDDLASALEQESQAPRWPREITAAVRDPRERELLGRVEEVLGILAALPAPQAALVREVVTTIIGGQRFDLERFATGTAERPVVLADSDELLGYAKSVAGCVGVFWTRLGLLTLGADFSDAPENELLRRAENHGVALQLVNILRDLPADLAQGRCYLPVPDPGDRPALLRTHAGWLLHAERGVADGLAYAALLKQRRIRAASALPALLAAETLRLLEHVTWEELAARPKVPRRRVWRLVLRAFRG